MFRPEGVFFAMVTPFKEGKIYEPTLRQIVEFNIQKGVHGLFPVSTCGEFIQMDFAEKVRMMEIVMDQAAGRVAVTPGVSSANPRESIALAKEAQRLGCDAIVALPPYYMPITQEMVEKHFELIAEAVDIPLILYNIPSHTNKITFDVAKRLSRRPNIVGMKDSSGSMVDTLHFIDKIKIAGRFDEFNFLTGREDMFFPALAVGAKGCMTGCSGIIPEIMVGIWDSFQKGDYDQARELQYSFLNLFRGMVALPIPIGLKVAMELRGFDMGEYVQPLSNAEKFNLVNVRSRIEKSLSALFGDYKIDMEQLMKKKCAS